MLAFEWSRRREVEPPRDVAGGRCTRCVPRGTELEAARDVDRDLVEAVTERLAHGRAGHRALRIDVKHEHDVAADAVAERGFGVRQDTRARCIDRHRPRAEIDAATTAVRSRPAVTAA